MPILPSLNALRADPDEITFRVDRSDELRMLRTALMHSGSNVFLNGPRGIGKTYLLRVFRHEVSALYKDVLIVDFPVDVTFAMHVHDSNAPLFALAFGLSLVSSVWRTVLQLQHADLVQQTQLESKHFHIQRQLQQAVVELRLATISTELQVEHEGSVSAGLTAIVKGDIQRKSKKTQKLKPSISIDYHAHLSEISERLDKEFGIKRIVVLCDEANRLPDIWQKELLEHHMDLFRDLGMNFVFVSGFSEGLNDGNVLDGYGVRLELKGLDRNALTELCEGISLANGLSIEPEVVTAIHNAFKGNPRFSVAVLNDAIYRCSLNASKSITTDLIRPIIKNSKSNLSERLKLILRSKGNGK